MSDVTERWHPSVAAVEAAATEIMVRYRGVGAPNDFAYATALTALEAACQVDTPRPRLDREAVAQVLHDLDHMHEWRDERCDDACGIAAFRRADAVLNLTPALEGT